MAKPVVLEDDRERPEWGVGVFVIRHKDQFKVVFDDLKKSGDAEIPEWTMWSFVTSGLVDAERFLAHELTDEEYARFGMAVASRLAAQLSAHR